MAQKKLGGDYGTKTPALFPVRYPQITVKQLWEPRERQKNPADGEGKEREW